MSFAVVVSERSSTCPTRTNTGSGNPGATNVLRTGNKAAALLTLLGDGVKGFVAVFAAQHLAPLAGAPEWTVAAAALAVFLGHLYPVFHQVRRRQRRRHCGRNRIRIALAARHWCLPSSG